MALARAEWSGNRSILSPDPCPKIYGQRTFYRERHSDRDGPVPAVVVHMIGEVVSAISMRGTRLRHALGVVEQLGRVSPDSSESVRRDHLFEPLLADEAAGRLPLETAQDCRHAYILRDQLHQARIETPAVVESAAACGALPVNLRRIGGAAGGKAAYIHVETVRAKATSPFDEERPHHHDVREMEPDAVGIVERYTSPGRRAAEPANMCA